MHCGEEIIGPALVVARYDGEYSFCSNNCGWRYFIDEGDCEKEAEEKMMDSFRRE